MQSFDLSKNFISDKVGVMLAQGLKNNRSLKSFYLAENTLTEVTAVAFLLCLKNQNYLSKLDLSKNLIPIKFIIDINKLCERNGENLDPVQIPLL